MRLAHAKPVPDSQGYSIHELYDHLFGVSSLAADFAAAFGAREWGATAGLWHDLGKYRPSFQTYLRAAVGLDADATSASRTKHAIVGAIHAIESRGPYGRLLGYAIAGHHAGLPDWYPDEATGEALKLALEAETSALREAREGGAPVSVLAPDIQLPQPLISEPREMHLWIRMLFSALVDADFLDTESFMDEGRSGMRSRSYADIEHLRAAYDEFMHASFATANTDVNVLRGEILERCRRQASLPPGLFTLTVPTGGGKTLASLGFALDHAAHHSLKRIIYVIPYTSIIEQTADVLRRVFAAIEPDPVIEHHSNLDPETETLAMRLASENWDAPIIVTTNVQFLESLYATRTSRCRKLHNIIESVVIFDEAQLLPPENLEPILDALRQLRERYRVSIVLSTATQPELTKSRSNSLGRTVLTGLGEATELAPSPTRLYEQLRRVTVALPEAPDVRSDWDEIAAKLEEYPQVLCIVNRRDDAAQLWRKMSGTAVHLSASMCGEHRSQMIKRIRDLLTKGEPVRVISTQLVEAGVDFDFPVVFRAMAGLDSIAQAAGRCNREGRIPNAGGQVVVFHPPQPSPSGLLLKAEQAAALVLDGTAEDPLTPTNFTRYFDLFYGGVNTHDKGEVLQLLNAGASKGEIQFRTAGQRFRLIDDADQQAVLVLWDQGSQLIKRLRREGPHRDLMRRLQRYSVTVYEHRLRRLMHSGDIVMYEGIPVQENPELYHDSLGLLPESPPIDPSSLTA